jgi:hypothetical protein
MTLDDYRAVDAAVAAHLDGCLVCPTGTCEAGLALLRVESATWAAFELADPGAAAAFAARAHREATRHLTGAPR